MLHKEISNLRQQVTSTLEKGPDEIKRIENRTSRIGLMEAVLMLEELDQLFK